MKKTQGMAHFFKHGSIVKYNYFGFFEHIWQNVAILGHF